MKVQLSSIAHKAHEPIRSLNTASHRTIIPPLPAGEGRGLPRHSDLPRRNPVKAGATAGLPRHSEATAGEGESLKQEYHAAQREVSL